MDMDDLYRLLRNAHLQAQGIVDTVRDPLVVLDRDLCVVSANTAFFTTFEVSREETIGNAFYKLGNGQWDVEELRDLLEKVIPRAVGVTDFEVDTVFPTIGRRTMLVTARKLVHPDNGRVLLLSIIDATDQQRRDQEKDIVIGELRHRMRNMLAVITSLARQTTTVGRTAEAYRDSLLGRLGTLIRATNLGLDSKEAVDISDLVQSTLRPYALNSDRFKFEQAPSVMLDADKVVPVSLILHELATNALKYGALSHPAGHLRIGWSVERINGDHPQELRLFWRETGVAKTPSETRGFGTRLIEFATRRDLCGEMERIVGRDSFSIEIKFPI